MVNSSGKHSCSEHTKYHSHKTCNISEAVSDDTTAHFRLAFKWDQPLEHLTNPVDNQRLNMPHLSGRWIILAKELCSLTLC